MDFDESFKTRQMMSDYNWNPSHLFYIVSHFHKGYRDFGLYVLCMLYKFFVLPQMFPH